MTETEFRLKHSEFIEYYQYIEMRLKDIYAALCARNENDFFNYRDKVKRLSPKKLFTKLKKEINKHPYKCLSNEDFVQLDSVK